MSAPATPGPTAADVLRTALELIPDEQHWLKGVFGEANGEPIIEPIALYAAYAEGRLDRCCAEGALWVACRRLHVAGWFGQGSPWDYLSDQIGGVVLTAFNDSEHTTYAEIANAFRRAIAVAEAAEGRKS